MQFKLRDYQEKAVAITLKKIKDGKNKQVHVLATGLGKTVIFSHIIAKRVNETGKKALVLAHREELLTQARDKIIKIEPSLRVEIEMADQKASPDCDVIIASVATIGRSASARIKKFDPKDFCIIVVDEAHHASATTYKNVLAWFGVLKETPQTDWNKDCLLLGVTATPSRNDNEGIDKIFDEVVYDYGILDGIRDGWLSRIRAYRVNTKTSLEEVHTLAGDFNQGELADAINNPERNELVVKTYKEQFDGKQALVFAINIEHSQALEKIFQDKGVNCSSIDGNTPKPMRALTLEGFHNKDIQVVVNCMVLTEGYDNDTIDVIMMARPTKSGILYQQMVGRGTRTHHEKPYLTIVDFVDNTYKHTIKTSASLLGLQGMVNFAGEDILDALGEIERIKELAPDFNLDRLDFSRLDYIMEEVDLMAGLDIPTDIKEYTQNAWHRYNEGYRLGIGDGRYFVIQQAITGQWKATLEHWDKLTKTQSMEYLGEEEMVANIVKRVDKYIDNNHNDSNKLIDMGARWRKDKPSDAQITALKRLGVDEGIIAQLDKGKASQLQTRLYGVRGYRR